MKKLSLILFIFTAFLTSCYYMDLDSHEVDISSDYYPDVYVSSNLDGLDSIKLVDSLYFIYNIDIDTGKLYFADVYLGQYQLSRSKLNRDSLWIFSSNSMPEGEYELTLTAYYKTYTGSLADLYNAEFFAKDTSWIVKFEPDI